MSADFDPYQEWLSIPPNERPANHYRLLGLPLFESNTNVISNAADRQMTFVRTFQTGQYSQQSQQILNELSQARVTLLDKRKKEEYDAKLRAEQKSGSNGRKGIASSLGSYGEVQSAPPPSASSLTPQPQLNDPQGANPDAPSHATPPGDAMPVPPLPDSPNRSGSFLKKHWLAILIAFVAVQLVICGSGLLAYLLQPSKTEVAQNAAEQSQKVVDDAKDDSQSSETVQLAKRFYGESVDLQKKKKYDAALIKISVAVDLQPDNKQYKAKKKELMRLKESSEELETSQDPVIEPEQPLEPESGEEAKAKEGTKAKAEAVYNEAVALQKQGKYIQAAEKLNEAIELDPDNEQFKEEKAQFDQLSTAEESYKESVNLEQKEQYAVALIKIEEALAIDPNNEDFIKEKLDIQTRFYKQYVLHRIKREYLQALEKINEAIKLVPEEKFYKEEKQKTEELAKAVEEGKELPEKDPDYGEPEELAEEPVEELEQQGFKPGKVAGERKVVNIDGIMGVAIAFRWCPTGKFIMGSPTSETGRKADEKQHEVELTKGFWIMETQITVGMFKAFVNDTGYKSKGLTPWGLSNGKWNQDEGYSWLNPGFAQDDNSPVTCISWRDVAAFSKWLGSKIESKTKLPTEAQWEYACRAGSKSAYFWGDALNGDKANCNGNYPCGTTAKGPYLVKTAPVRSYQRNAWGVYDMHGNVWEWCLDGYVAYPNGKATDPLERGDGTNRVFRGGSWSYKAERCRSAFRANFVPAIRLPNMGGRCVVEPSDSEPIKIPFDENTGNRDVEVINGVEFAFRWCPAGTFMMGSPKTEKGRHDSEKQHRVTLTKGFWMLETEVTVGMFKAFVNDTGYVSKGNTPYGWTGTSTKQNSNYTWLNPGFIQNNKHPVTSVSWDDAVAFCKWLSKKTGKNITLPTEVQWEYACRAGTTGAYIGRLDSIAWYSLKVDKWYSSKRSNKTHPVGTKKPNAWGLYDMQGNVSEWCADWYGDYPSGSVTDPVETSSGSTRVIRGSDWNDYDSKHFRSAARSHCDPSYRSCDLGFRVVREQ